MDIKTIELQEKNLLTNKQFEKFCVTKKKLANIIFKHAKSLIKSEKTIKSLYNKISLDLPFLIYLSEQQLFRQNSYKANALTKWLKKNKYLSSKSKIYPANQKFLTSTLSKSFLKADMPDIDKILDLRDNLFNEYYMHLDIAVYIYLRVYNLHKIQKEDITKIDYNTNVFTINQAHYLFVAIHKRFQDGYIPLNKYFLDEKIAKVIQDNFADQPLFIKSEIAYEKELNKYLKKNNLLYRNIKRAIEFEYSYYNTPLKLFFKLETNYPKLNLLELEHIFPGLIPLELLEIEQHNKDIYFNILIENSLDLDADDEKLDHNSKANEYIQNNLEEYDCLSKCVNVPLNDKDFKIYLHKYYKVITEFKANTDNNHYLYFIFDFVEYLLKKADNEDSGKRADIKKRTLKEYLRIIFRYCFDHIVIDGGITDKTLQTIHTSINLFHDEQTLNFKKNITPKSTKTYYRIIKRFIKKYTLLKTESQIRMAVDIRRSIVYKDEIELLITKISIDEKIKYDDSKFKTFKTNIKSTFCLLLYYSGVRKTELRTLLSQNIYQINYNQFEIIISKNNFKAASKANNELELKQKSDNAIRKIRFIVNDNNHLRIILKHIEFIQKHNYIFVFPSISDKGVILKKKVMKESYISHLSKDLSNITNRYTPLHSLRHSYATFKTMRIFEQNSYQHSLMYQLSVMMGHSEPIVTIENYIHIDNVFILSNYMYEYIPDLYFDYSVDIEKCLTS